MDLQYLPPEKQREKEPDIRKMLLETIMLVGPPCRAVGPGGGRRVPLSWWDPCP